MYCKRIFCLILTLAVLSCCCSAFAAGEKTDPLITKQFLDTQVYTDLYSYARSSLSNGFQIVRSQLSALQAPPKTTGSAQLVYLTKDQAALAPLGGSVVLLDGVLSYRVIYGTLLNLSTGDTLIGDGTVERGYRYMAAENSMVLFTAESAAQLTLDGTGAVYGGNQSMPTFQDVTTRSWAFSPIETMAALKLVNGTGNANFQPESNMTRADFVTVLGRLYGIDISDYRRSAFDDVPASTYYAPYVTWASENGIVSGYGNDRFGPQDSITRAQMAVLLIKYARFVGITLPKPASEQFADHAQIPAWAKDDIYMAKHAGYIEGNEKNQFLPNNTSRRMEVCAVIARMLTT